MTVHRAGRGSVLGLLILLILVNAFLFKVVGSEIAIYVFALVSLVFFLICLNYYRSPKRIFIGDRVGAIACPADGTIVTIEKVHESEYFGDERLQVSVFMSVFNVHANWFPIDGRVVMKQHHQGRFHAAYLPKSSTENERTTTVLRRSDGLEILVRQVAGAVARRIVTYPKVGEEGIMEDHLGFIKLGSRVDLYLPVDADIHVYVGQKVKACKTQIGYCESLQD